MPDTLPFPPTMVVDAEDRALAARLVHAIAAGCRARVTLDRPLPPAARPAVEALADELDELDRDLSRLRRRRGAPPSTGGRIRLAVAEAALLGGYVRDVAEALAALRGAGVGVVSGTTGKRRLPPPPAEACVVLRLHW